jgi:hypothetical protein
MDRRKMDKAIDAILELGRSAKRRPAADPPDDETRAFVEAIAGYFD